MKNIAFIDYKFLFILVWVKYSIETMSKLMLKDETPPSVGFDKNRLPSTMDNDVYIGFYGWRNVFSNFYSTPLKYKTVILNSEGKPEEPKKNKILDFKSAEALYQWKKAMSSPQENNCYALTYMSPPDGEVCCSIRNAATASIAKHLGRVTVKVNRSSWCLENRIAAMREVVNLKFPVVKSYQMPPNWDPESIYTCPSGSCHSPSLSIRLLYTGNAVLLENSPFDKIWGTGSGDREFDVLIKNVSLKSKRSIKDILAEMYPIPIPVGIKEQGNRTFGLNLLGRILMEQRTKLRHAFINETADDLVNHTKEKLHAFCEK